VREKLKESDRGCRERKFHVAGLVLALIKTEWPVLVAHQGNVDKDAVEPAVDAEEKIENGAGVPPGDQQPGEDDDQIERRVAADGLQAGGQVDVGPPTGGSGPREG
jgi:hypothetical protein